MIKNGLIIDGKVYALEKAENCDCKECSLYELCKEYENDDREVTFCAIKVDNNDDILIYSEYNEDAYEIEKSEIDWNSNNVHFLTGWSDVLNWYTLCNICESIESYEECNIKK